jgi:HAD superfamily hydrolase (TIGR01459 family)
VSVYRSIAGLSEIAGDYDLLLCDVFGTLHDAGRTFPAALDALVRFRRGGGAVVLVSNAAEPGDALSPGLAAKGIAGVSDGLVSAGDVTRAVLRERRPGSVLHIGAERDRIVFDGVSARLDDTEADLVVCTGYPEDDTGLDDLLREASRRGAPLLCTNPDTSVVVGGRLLRFAGLVAHRYRALGGAVTDTGKPGPLIYAAALSAAREATGRTFDPGRILALGDTPALDGGGALAAGYAAALLTPAEADPPDLPGDGRRFRLPALCW